MAPADTDRTLDEAHPRDRRRPRHEPGCDTGAAVATCSIYMISGSRRDEGGRCHRRANGGMRSACLVYRRESCTVWSAFAPAYAACSDYVQKPRVLCARSALAPAHTARFGKGLWFDLCLMSARAMTNTLTSSLNLPPKRRQRCQVRQVANPAPSPSALGPRRSGLDRSPPGNPPLPPPGGRRRGTRNTPRHARDARPTTAPRSTPPATHPGTPQYAIVPESLLVGGVRK
jgi:hypothetical protein